MNKYLLDDDGNITLDENGNKVLNPDWVAANTSYTPAADEVDETGTLTPSAPGDFEPDDQALAWHNSQVEGLKQNQQKALGQLSKLRTRADTAETERDAAKTALAEFSAVVGDMDPGDLKQRLEKLKQFEAGELENKGINEDEILERGRKGAENRLQPQIDARDTEISNLKEKLSAKDAELHKFKYDGRIQQASIGILKKGYETVGIAALKTMIKENDEGELECYDVNGDLAIDNLGVPLKPEEFISTVFTKAYPDLCVKDKAPDVSGAPGGGNGNRTKNPFASDTINRTVQATIIKNDPEKARKLMRAAGYDTAKINRLLAA